MSVLLEALKKAAEQRAAADAKEAASQEEGISTTVGEPRMGSSGGSQEIKDDQLSLHAAMQPQQAEDTGASGDDEAGMVPSGIPLKIKLPVTEAPDEAVADKQDAYSSEGIEDNKNRLSLDDTNSFQRPKPFTEVLDGDSIPPDAMHEAIESESVTTSSLHSHSIENEPVTNYAPQAASIEDSSLKLAEEPELLSSSGSEDWIVPDADNNTNSAEDMDFVPSQRAEDTAESPASAIPDESAISASEEEPGTDSDFQVQDPSILVRSQGARRRVSPSLLLLAVLIVTASVAVIWGFYQNTQPALPNRYAHIADRHEHELTILSDIGKTRGTPGRPPAPEIVHPPALHEHVPKPIAEKKRPETGSTRQENSTVRKKVSEPGPHKVTPHAAITHIAKKKGAEKKEQSHVAQLKRREQRKPLTSHTSLSDVTPNAKQTVSVEQCFEQLLQEGTQGEACNHIDNTSVRLAFEAYRLFRSGQVEQARRLIQQAYSTAPYNIYVAQMYALIGGDAIPLKQLESLHEIFPGAVIIALQLANRYALSGSKDKALDILMQALEEQPHNGYLLYNAALLAYEMNNKTLASGLLRRIPAYQLRADSQLGEAVHDLEALVSNG
jgi:Flp pilus assembly protein TadD